MHTASTPRAIDVLLARYGESHRNPVNELIHIVCIPAIVFSLLGILWAIHPIVPLLVVAVALVYYSKLSRTFALGMAVMAGAMLVLLALLPDGTVLPTSIGVFVAAWDRPVRRPPYRGQEAVVLRRSAPLADRAAVRAEHSVPAYPACMVMLHFYYIGTTGR